MKLLKEMAWKLPVGLVSTCSSPYGAKFKFTKIDEKE